MTINYPNLDRAEMYSILQFKAKEAKIKWWEFKNRYN